MRHLFGRCVQVPPAGLTGEFRRRRRGGLRAEGRVGVGLVMTFTLTFMHVLRLCVVAQPVAASCEHTCGTGTLSEWPSDLLTFDP